MSIIVNNMLANDVREAITDYEARYRHPAIRQVNDDDAWSSYWLVDGCSTQFASMKKAREFYDLRAEKQRLFRQMKSQSLVRGA